MLSFRILEFFSYPSKYWNSYLTIRNNRILILSLRPFRLLLSFQSLEFFFYPFKHWISHLILLNNGILILFFETLEFLSHPFKR